MISGSKSKIREFAGHALVGDQDVLRFQVPVIDSNRMAVLHGIQNLEESSLGKGIITNVLALLSDVGEEIAFWAVLNNNVCAVRSIHDLNKGNNVGVSTSLVVKLDLPLLELSLTRLEANLVQCLHSIGDVGLDVHGSVNNSISANTKDSSQL